MWQLFFILIAFLFFLVFGIALLLACYLLIYLFIEQPIRQKEATIVLIALCLMIPSGLIVISEFISEASLISTRKNIKEIIDNDPRIAQYHKVMSKSRKKIKPLYFFKRIVNRNKRTR